MDTTVFFIAASLVIAAIATATAYGRKRSRRKRCPNGHVALAR